MKDRQFNSSTDKFDGDIRTGAVSHYYRPSPGVLVESSPSGITYAIFNFSGVTIRSDDTPPLDSIIPCY